jgi:oxygen-dependent protoporphyrinogen oxidase
VGGGITGLAAAYELSRAAEDAEIIVLESSERLGGKLHTQEFAGARIEAGADSFLARDPAMLELMDELDLKDQLVAPSIFSGQVWDGERLYGLPTRNVMGIPITIGAALGTKGLSPRGRVRALGDLVLFGPLKGPDASVGDVLTRRFGREVLDALVDPLLAGTRAGDPNRMSLAAALPQVNAAARRGRSVMRGLRRAAGGGRSGPLFLAPKDGMSTIVEAFANALEGAKVQTATRVTRLSSDQDHDYNVTTEFGETLQANGVVLALPATEGARLVSGVCPEAAPALNSIARASVAVITLAYPVADLTLPQDASGFLVPTSAGLTLSAGTWWSTKWRHTTPSDTSVVRCFIGRAGRDPALQQTDEALIHAATREIGLLLRSSALPSDAVVTRWVDGLPQYEVGHLDTVSAIESALERGAPGVAVAGADFRGSGVPDCIAQGRRAATAVLRAAPRGQVKVTT